MLLASDHNLRKLQFLCIRSSVEKGKGVLFYMFKIWIPLRNLIYLNYRRS